MKEDLFRDIITRFLEGHATAHEKEMLSNWLKQDAVREEVFYFELSKRENDCPQYLPEMESKLAAYERFLQGEMRISGCRKPHEEAVQSPARRFRYWLAASVVLFVSAGFYFLSDSLLYKTYTAQSGMTRAVMLEDGSIVTLNANSSIKVPRDFTDHERREVWVRGEAFFEVTRQNNAMKFIVHTNNVDVEVLGTKFNVNTRRCKTEVILAEGTVKLVSEDRVPVIMKPGEKVTLLNADAEFQKQIVNPEKYEAWRNNMLVFQNTPLADVALIIQDYYGVEVDVSDPGLATRQFTGTLPNNDLDVILLALSTAYNIAFEQNGDRIILKK